jgi:hypothetical protein
MNAQTQRLQRGARYTLSAIRLTVGSTALLAPRTFARRLEVDTTRHPAIIYVLRLFGIRTVFIGTDLLLRDQSLQTLALRSGVVIHASDTMAALIAAASGQLPRGAALRAALLSGINTLLAIVALRGSVLPKAR